MQFVRSYHNNVASEDSFYEKKSGGSVDRLKPEVFNNINKIVIETVDGSFVFTKLEVYKVIESFNYFTILYKNNKIQMIKYTHVKSVTFE